MPLRRTYLDVVRECDGFPYTDEEGEYKRVLSDLYRFRLQKVWGETANADAGTEPFVTVGFMLPAIVAAIPWTDKFQVDHAGRTVSLPWTQEAGDKDDSDDSFETRAIAEQVQRARDANRLAILRKWRGEPYRVRGLTRPPRHEVRMARGASALFGIHTVGVHALGFCRRSESDDDDDGGGMMLWIPRRAPGKQTFPGMLDNTVGGGLTADDADGLACLVREAAEEASLPESLVRACARPVGAISYFSVRDERAGGSDEVGLLQPATQLLYDLELPVDVVPKPLDGEVAEFMLWTPAQTMAGLLEGRFKPNSALAWIDFLIRHGYITPQAEPDYMELVSRIHRRISF